MSTATFNFGLNAQRVRVIPSVTLGTSTDSSPGNLSATGGTTVVGGVTYRTDNTFGKRLSVSNVPGTGATAFDSIGIYSRGSILKTSDTVLVIGRFIDLIALVDQPCELRVYFGPTMSTNPDTSTAHGAFSVTGINGFNQTADYPPLFVPSDVTKWTVYRRIEISDRFAIPVLFNLSGAPTGTYRFTVRTYDSQN